MNKVCNGLTEARWIRLFFSRAQLQLTLLQEVSACAAGNLLMLLLVLGRADAITSGEAIADYTKALKEF